MSLFLPTAKAFPGMGDKGAAMLRVDLNAAGVPYIDEYGRYGDFHALRHTFASQLNQARVPLVTAQRLLRHSDPKLTAGIYTHVMLADKADELKKLPVISAAAPENNAGTRTGTDDAPAASESVDRPGDSRGVDSMANIKTYRDDQAGAKQEFIRFPETEKAPVPQGQTGALTFGAGEALREELQLLLYQYVSALYSLKYLHKYPQIHGVLLSLGGWG